MTLPSKSCPVWALLLRTIYTARYTCQRPMYTKRLWERTVIYDTLRPSSRPDSASLQPEYEPGHIEDCDDRLCVTDFAAFDRREDLGQGSRDHFDELVGLATGLDHGELRR